MKQFFARSIFRSGLFITVSLVGVTCIALELLIAYRYWTKLSDAVIAGLALVLAGIVNSWRKALSYHERIRERSLDGATNDVAIKATLAVALETVERFATDVLIFCFSSIFLLLIIVNHVLSHDR
jgi:hypothetical protein